tara:strand:+ start:16 stop:387 length:372 start_codon:yes stop_codon:yes gene_type:complete
MRYDPIFRYKGLDRKIFKLNKGYLGYVNDHHIIPKQLKHHLLLKEVDFDINSRFNLIIMPTSKGVKKLNLHPDTITHSCHPKYNERVKNNLDNIYNAYKTKDHREYMLWLLVNWLRENGKYLM